LLGAALVTTTLIGALTAILLVAQFEFVAGITLDQPPTSIRLSTTIIAFTIFWQAAGILVPDFIFMAAGILDPDFIFKAAGRVRFTSYILVVPGSFGCGAQASRATVAVLIPVDDFFSAVASLGIAGAILNVFALLDHRLAALSAQTSKLASYIADPIKAHDDPVRHATTLLFRQIFRACLKNEKRHQHRACN